MRSSAVVLVAVFATSTVATRTRSSRIRRQDGPVDPGTAADCTYFDTALDSSYTCTYFEDYWTLSHADFVDYNPGVKSDCSGIKVGNSYCVEVNFGLPRPTSKTTSPSASPTTASPTVTSTPKPSPTQDGLTPDCIRFYKVVEDDNCDKIVAAYGNTFTLADFYKWNPAVGSGCRNLWKDTYYCVGVPGTPTASPTMTTPPVTTTTAPPTGPSPTQPGIPANCQRYHLAVEGDTCQGIVDRYSTFNLAQFYSWNPAVGTDCKNLWVGNYYCIGIPGTPTTTQRTTTTTTTTKPPAETCNPAAPTPTQPTAICGCKKWHMVVSGNTCDSIVKQYGITSANFHKWNPGVGSDCKSLWVTYYVCVGV